MIECSDPEELVGETVNIRHPTVSERSAVLTELDVDRYIIDDLPENCSYNLNLRVDDESLDLLWTYCGVQGREKYIIVPRPSWSEKISKDECET